MTAPPPPAALLFPGQGAQQPGMGVGLYRSHPGFRARMDEVLELWHSRGFDLRADWLAGACTPEADGIRVAQPLLYALNWAVGRTVLDAGVRPAALLGHSVGEVAAATLAGVFEPAEAVGLMADRITHLDGTPRGGMLAVLATPEELAPYLTRDVVVGAVNAPRQVLVSGPDPELGEVEARLRADGFTARRSRAHNPFHSPVLTEAALRALPGLARLTIREPRLPLYSGYEPGPLTGERVLGLRYWALQPARPVLFGPALDGLLAERDLLLAEAGPGQGLTALVRRHPAVTRGGSRSVSLLPARPGTPEAERAVYEKALAELANAPAAGPVTPAGPAGPPDRSGEPAGALSRPVGAAVPALAAEE
ncbi:acyltransferase domain-containing protein [Kitasatospora sp. NPDC096147]|uniref:acyltransferase domain-containing protein n=1 Tax=Kitasatospora sp. NPDC096147 TaxID=3364093 RepID=UPI0038196283